MRPDKIHYTLQRILSYNKHFNYVISAREAGKTTSTWLYAYNLFKQGKEILVLRRNMADITDTYVDDISNVINKFSDDPIVFEHKKCSGSSSCDVFVKDSKGEKRLFFRVLALSNPLSRIKSLMMPNLQLIVFDEFICNTRMGEKYLKDEVFRFKEIYNTFQRECDNLRVIFLGNPYSLYNPYFVWAGFPAKDLYPGSICVKNDHIVECYQLTDELKEFILSRNPLYQFDDSYTKYAFDGRAVNDENIYIVDKQPDYFGLRHIFYINNKKVGFFGSYESKEDFNIWVSILPDSYVSKNRFIYAVDINDLINGVKFLNKYDKSALYILKLYFESRRVAFKTIEEYYLARELYDCL